MTQKKINRKTARGFSNIARGFRAIGNSFVSLCVAIVVILLIVGGVTLAIYFKRNKKTATDRVEDIKQFYNDGIVGSEGKVETYSVPDLTDIIDIGELQTLSYHYNAINKVRIDHKVRYYVAYEGSIQLGVDFNEVVFSFDEENHIITVTLPPIKVTNAEVVASSLDYIFVDESYNNEKVFTTAYSACQADLKEQASRDQKLSSIAKTNTEAEMKALIQPFLEEFYPEYTLNIEWRALTPDDIDNPMDNIVGGKEQ